MEGYWLISEAAREVEVESHVLRYWEEELKLPIKRNEQGHRYYTREDVEFFKQIKGMKEKGLQLKAIKLIMKNGDLDVLADNGELTAKMQDNDHAEAQGKKDMEAKKTQTQDAARGQVQEKVQTQNAVRGQAQEKVQTQDAAHGKVHEKAYMQVQGMADGTALKENKEEKTLRLQWLLQQLIREAVRENNRELTREIKESVVKELDYQFRNLEEREEQRDAAREQREEEHFRKLDELLRKKARKAKKTNERTEREVVQSEEVQKDRRLRAFKGNKSR